MGIPATPPLRCALSPGLVLCVASGVVDTLATARNIFQGALVQKTNSASLNIIPPVGRGNVPLDFQIIIWILRAKTQTDLAYLSRESKKLVLNSIRSLT